jgi:hypothetical protein
MTTPLEQLVVSRKVFSLIGLQPRAQGIDEVEAQIAGHELDIPRFSSL